MENERRSEITSFLVELLLSWNNVGMAMIGDVNIIPSTGQENNTAQPKEISYFASYLIFHRFALFDCCLSVIL